MNTRARDSSLTRQLLQEFEARCREPFPFLLDSALDPLGRGGLSLAGADPFAVLVARGREIELYREGCAEFYEGDVFESLRTLLAEIRGQRVYGVGYLGYDLGGLIEVLPQRAVDDQDFPDLVVAFYERLTWADHRSGRIEHWPGSGRLPALSAEQLRERFVTPRRPIRNNFTREEYLSAIRRAREYIAAGDIYQVNLSQRFASHTALAPHELYRRLREASPAPYAAFFGFGNHALISSSPEEYLSVRGRRLRTTPIKGTRPRGRTNAEDEVHRRELLDSPKDAAELMMIVDLERNDLGRVCEAGSVRVPVLKRLEAHPTVWHLSATVEGILEQGLDLVDLLRATFPGGSVTGAPKIRAMEIIDELEPTRRGAFTGSLVCFDGEGTLGSSIAIRTMQWHDHSVSFQVGGAIVWDSEPEAEYEETLVKARGMARALGL